MFAEIAPTYDFLNRLLSLRTDVGWRRRVFRELRLPAEAFVLDVCTGTADLAIEALAASPGDRPRRVIGADFTPEMVRIGERKRLRGCVKGLSLVVADALRLPFPEETFDAVTVAFGVRNLADLAGGFREMRRVLKPGGQVAILEFSAQGHPGFRKCFDFYFHRLLPRIGGWVSRSSRGREAYEYLPRSVQSFPSPETVSSLLTECGFVEARAVPLTFGVAVVYLARRSSSNAKHTVGAVVGEANP